MSLRPQILAAAVLASVATLAPPAAFAQSVSGEPLRLENAKRNVTHAFKAATVAPQGTLRFQPLDIERVAAMQRHNVANGGKRLQVGIGRSVSDEAETLLQSDLAWTPVAGGKVLRFDVVSPAAAALRVGLELRGLPEGAELRVASAKGGVVEFANAGAMEAGVDGEGVYWSPVTDGDTQRLELFVPQGATTGSARVRSISHLVISPFRNLRVSKELGSSGTCNIDVACRTGTLGQPFINAKNAVAHMLFQEGAASFWCTGNLMNDSTPASQVPYFYSAAHCFNSQAIANTLATFWNYETPTCGTQSSGPNTQVTGGSDLLFQSLSSDVLFLRLRATPPAGAFLVGWSAATLAPSTEVIAIHHPNSDNKKYSRGMHGGMIQNYDLDGQILTSVASATWLEGTTETGSSGSGMFSFNGTDYQLRGGLAGGFGSCENSGLPESPTGNQDVYSRFDLAYPSLQQWLGNAVGPSRNYSGAWFVPAESGWGLTVFNFPGQMFALFFVYDSQGRPTWYRFQGAWTGADQVTANLDRATGPAWSSSFNPNAVSYATVGTGTMTFTSATSATLTFNDGTVNRTVTLSKL
ncbi:hypothetical protein [Silanimonas sp.]|jgi:lysyl endopeptidase|uniref:hypothetical protein n=1 Tax=Silanimonas sp. TaxID=1929290 RepID=UPI0022C79F81|nr:hypothetical protein [Silanimonas sp.]MCZ8115155.1 hypothetical protein [Silanimonas sp.]